MLERIERVAHLSVARACGFAAVAIGTMIVGFSGDMQLALKAGGFLTLLVCLVLLLKAQLVRTQPYKRTEVWLMLRPEERPQAAIAQQIIATVLRETYLQFALHAGLCAAGCLTGSLLLALLR
ncbi:MAG: hypothetical protein ACKVP7_00950 [Hyphomicrobiaceae bacterium]